MDGAGYIVHPLEQQMVAPDVGELVGEDGLELGVCQQGKGGGIHQQHRAQRPRPEMGASRGVSNRGGVRFLPRDWAHWAARPKSRWF